MLAVVCPPGAHVYVEAPEALRVALLPLQIVEEGETLMLTVGRKLTVTVLVAAFVHPSAFVPVTVYEVVVVGFIEMAAVVCPPGDHA